MNLPKSSISINSQESAPRFPRSLLVVTAIWGLLSAGHSALAQESDAETEALAKAAQNPIASLISLPFQNNTIFDYGPDGDAHNALNIQPVWPFKLNDDWNFITRTILPVVSTPGVSLDEGRTTGLGDTTFTGFFSPTKGGAWTWGVGPVVVLPTSTDDALGAGEWAAGASVVFLTMPGKWVVGSLLSNVWDVNASDGNDIDFFTWQYFVNYNLDDGWYLTSAPIITANWEAKSSQRWTVPFGGGVGKIFRIGKQPVNVNAQVYYNAEKPDIVGDWSLRLQFQLMFPK